VQLTLPPATSGGHGRARGSVGGYSSAGVRSSSQQRCRIARRASIFDATTVIPVLVEAVPPREENEVPVTVHPPRDAL
jgi:hypothetical protein